MNSDIQFPDLSQHRAYGSVHGASTLFKYELTDSGLIAISDLFFSGPVKKSL